MWVTLSSASQRQVACVSVTAQYSTRLWPVSVSLHIKGLTSNYIKFGRILERSKILLKLN
jgi:hypothetical protein